MDAPSGELYSVAGGRPAAAARELCRSYCCSRSVWAHGTEGDVFRVWWLSVDGALAEVGPPSSHVAWRGTSTDSSRSTTTSGHGIVVNRVFRYPGHLLVQFFKQINARSPKALAKEPSSTIISRSQLRAPSTSLPANLTTVKPRTFAALQITPSSFSRCCL